MQKCLNNILIKITNSKVQVYNIIGFKCLIFVLKMLFMHVKVMGSNYWGIKYSAGSIGMSSQGSGGAEKWRKNLA